MKPPLAGTYALESTVLRGGEIDAYTGVPYAMLTENGGPVDREMSRRAGCLVTRDGRPRRSDPEGLLVRVLVRVLFEWPDAWRAWRRARLERPVFPVARVRASRWRHFRAWLRYRLRGELISFIDLVGWHWSTACAGMVAS